MYDVLIDWLLEGLDAARERLLRESYQQRFTISEVAADWHELMVYCSDTVAHYTAAIHRLC